MTSIHRSCAPFRSVGRFSCCCPSTYTRWPMLPNTRAPTARWIWSRWRTSWGKLASLRHHGLEGSSHLSCNGLEIDRQRHRATIHGRDLELTVTEFQLVWTMASRPGHVHTREQLFESCKRGRNGAQLRTVDAHIKAIRRKLRDHAGYYPNDPRDRLLPPVGSKRRLAVRLGRRQRGSQGTDECCRAAPRLGFVLEPTVLTLSLRQAGEGT